MLTMARKKAAAVLKVASKIQSDLISGPYPLENFRSVVALVIKKDAVVKITIPHTWAKSSCPILSPNALRLIQLLVGSDKELGTNFMLDLGRGRKK